MSNHFDVTVIIPTYNRGEKVLNSLASLEKQTFRNFEVIVVNDGSTDNTREVLDAKAGEFNLSLSIIHQENGGRAKVRNRGAKEAKEGLLIFMDDDMRFDPGTVEFHVYHHIRQPGSILAGSAVEDIKLTKTDFQRYKAFQTWKWNSDIAYVQEPLDSHNLHIAAANFSIPKSVFLFLNGFDESLTDIEDYDLAIRAYGKGIPIYYDFRATGWHDDFVTCKAFIKRIKQYLKAHEYLLQIKAEVYTKFHRQPNKMPSLPKRLIYRFLRADYWVDLVDSEKLKFLPQNIRYRLYSAIVYANSMLRL